MLVQVVPFASERFAAVVSLFEIFDGSALPDLRHVGLGVRVIHADGAQSLPSALGGDPAPA